MLLEPYSVGDRSPVSIHDNSINQVTFIYVGVHIDRDFSWHTQVVLYQGSSAPLFSETTPAVWRL